MIGGALLGRVPVQAHLHRRIGTVGRGLDFDLVRPGGKIDGAAHVVKRIGGGNDVVLVGLQDVAVHTALEGTGGGEFLSVEQQRGIGSHGLQINPVVAVVRNGEGAGPRDGGVGG